MKAIRVLFICDVIAFLFCIAAVWFASADEPVHATYRTHGSVLLPDPRVTPGAVTGATKEQLCDPNFRTGTVRDVDAATKKAVCRMYGVKNCDGDHVEIDHLVPLLAGGSNSISNLWPQPAIPVPGFHEKDRVEVRGKEMFCKGQISLQEFQHQIATDWYQLYLEWFQDKK